MQVQPCKCYNVIWCHVVFESLYTMIAWLTYCSKIGIRGEKILNTGVFFLIHFEVRQCRGNIIMVNRFLVPLLALQVD